MNASLQEEREARNATCHPINNLPPELLEAILWLVIDMANQTHPGHRLYDGKASDVLLGLARICRHWRAVVIGSPRLWSHLDIELRSIPGAAYPSTRQIQLWLQRSRDHPLYIGFNANKSEANLTTLAFERVCQSVLSLLFAQAHRWVEARLYLDSLDLSRIVLPLVDHVPLLRHLWLEAQISTPTLPPPTGTLLRKARLTSFHWQGDFGQYSLHADPNAIFWSTLTQISLECLQSPMDCLNVLRNAPNLRNCTLEVIVGGPCPSDALPTRHILPHLHTLRLVGPGAICSILLPNLLLPSLTILKLISTASSHDDGLRNARSGLPLVTFLHQSPCQETLTHLVLAAIRLRQDDLCSFLPSLVNLESLEVLCKDYGDYALGNMVVETLDPDAPHPPANPGAPRSQCRLPKLTTLKIFGKFDPEDGLLSTVLFKRVGEEAKKRGIVSLQRIQVEYLYGSQRHVQDEQRLLKLQKEAILHQVVIR